jgi:hypothetical protein
LELPEIDRLTDQRGLQHAVVVVRKAEERRTKSRPGEESEGSLYLLRTIEKERSTEREREGVGRIAPKAPKVDGSPGENVEVMSSEPQRTS